MEYIITDYGAIGDGKTINTSFIQKAIDEAKVNEGSTVIIPEGVYLTGAIYLKQGVNLRIDGTLLGSLDLNDYTIGPTRFEGHEEIWPDALVNIDSLSHFSISGKGTVDGNGIPSACIEEFSLLYLEADCKRVTPTLCLPNVRLYRIMLSSGHEK